MLILSVDLVIGCVRLAKHLLEDGEASTLGNDTKIVIKSSLQVTFSHVHDYVDWLVQCPKSLKTTPGQKNFFLCPLDFDSPSRSGEIVQCQITADNLWLASAKHNFTFCIFFILILTVAIKSIRHPV